MTYQKYYTPKFRVNDLIWRINVPVSPTGMEIYVVRKTATGDQFNIGLHSLMAEYVTGGIGRRGTLIHLFEENCRLLARV